MEKEVNHSETMLGDQLRDELALHSHLFRMEAKDELGKIESRLYGLRAKVFSTVRAQAPAAMRNATLFTDRLFAAYRNFRKPRAPKRVGYTPDEFG